MSANEDSFGLLMKKLWLSKVGQKLTSTKVQFFAVSRQIQPRLPEMQPSSANVEKAIKNYESWLPPSSSPLLSKNSPSLTTQSSSNTKIKKKRRKKPGSDGRNKRYWQKRSACSADLKQVLALHHAEHIFKTEANIMLKHPLELLLKQWLKEEELILNRIALKETQIDSTDVEGLLEKLLKGEEEGGKLLGKCVEELKKKGVEFDLLKEDQEFEGRGKSSKKMRNTLFCFSFGEDDDDDDKQEWKMKLMIQEIRGSRGGGLRGVEVGSAVEGREEEVVVVESDLFWVHLIDDSISQQHKFSMKRNVSILLSKRFGVNCHIQFQV
ncbi:hypothetical protein LguiB_013073 [Lonicera macranthoides]